MNTTPVRVRAQAHGGKYIGPSVANGPVLSVLVEGKPIIDDVRIPNQASGTVVPQRDATSSPYTIIVQPPGAQGAAPGTYWLDPPPDGQADIVVQLPLAGPAAVQFRVTAFAPQPVHNSVMLALRPGGDYTGQPGVVVLIPGLYVPQFSAQLAGGVVNVQATVQMMCGCPITLPPAPQGTEPYWPSYEFEVTATFVRPGAVPTSIPLQCKGTDEFGGSLTLPPGAYACLLTARQPATGNTGCACTHLVVQQ